MIFYLSSFSITYTVALYGCKLLFLFGQVNPGNAPLVVGQLLDDECPEDFIKGLILSVRSLLPVEPLVDECEKRYRGYSLTVWEKYTVYLYVLFMCFFR